MKMLNSKWREAMLGATVIVAFACSPGCGGSGSQGSGSQGSGDPALVGTWVGTVADGSATSPDPTLWTFTVTSTGADVKMGTFAAYNGTYVADPSSNPKSITITITESAIPAYVGQASNGIYKIEGNTLTFAANKPGTTSRPTDFIPTPDGVTLVFTLTKQ
jgi:uncharacterized protein (TIGR03067 family)